MTRCGPYGLVNGLALAAVLGAFMGLKNQALLLLPGQTMQETAVTILVIAKVFINTQGVKNDYFSSLKSSRNICQCFGWHRFFGH